MNMIPMAVPRLSVPANELPVQVMLLAIQLQFAMRQLVLLSWSEVGEKTHGATPPTQRKTAK